MTRWEKLKVKLRVWEEVPAVYVWQGRKVWDGRSTRRPDGALVMGYWGLTRLAHEGFWPWKLLEGVAYDPAAWTAAHLQELWDLEVARERKKAEEKESRRRLSLEL